MQQGQSLKKAIVTDKVFQYLYC